MSSTRPTGRTTLAVLDHLVEQYKQYTRPLGRKTRVVLDHPVDQHEQLCIHIIYAVDAVDNLKAAAQDHMVINMSSCVYNLCCRCCWQAKSSTIRLSGNQHEQLCICIIYVVDTLDTVDNLIAVINTWWSTWAASYMIYVVDAVDNIRAALDRLVINMSSFVYNLCCRYSWQSKSSIRPPGDQHEQLCIYNLCCRYCWQSKSSIRPPCDQHEQLCIWSML